MYHDDGRDENGNLRSLGDTPTTVWIAGVQPHDGPEMVRMKIANLEKQREIERASAPDINMPHLFVVLAGIIALFFAYVLVKYSVEKFPTWRQQWSQQAEAKEILTRQAIRKRLFSDFSSTEDWPANVQAVYKKSTDKTLATILGESPALTANLSPARRMQMGAEIWLRLAGEQSRVQDVIGALPTKPQDQRMKALVYSIKFLREQCHDEIEAACLDLAKGYASELFNGIEGTALTYLPLSGKLASAPKVVALRERITKPLP